MEPQIGQIVSQKRKIKSKFSVPQRTRPISQRKRIKKTFGPDFIGGEALEVLYLYNIYGNKCDICSHIMFSTQHSINTCEEFFHCTNCHSSAHPGCLYIPEGEMLYQTQWQCNKCKPCCVCTKSDTKDYVIVCSDCNNGFHMKCLSNPIIREWHCENCSIKPVTQPSSDSLITINALNKRAQEVLAAHDSPQASTSQSTVVYKHDIYNASDISIISRAFLPNVYLKRL